MNITVYCGSSLGYNPAFGDAAEKLGEWIAMNRNTMVYGGGNIGLMGICADRVLELGGSVTGIIPEFLLEHEHGHEGDYKLEVVPDMSIRKARMIELADICIAMPGGPGTIEEISEVISHIRLRLIDIPCAFYNIDGYYEPVRAVYINMVLNGFMTEEDFNKILFLSSPEELASLDRFL